MTTSCLFVCGVWCGHWGCKVIFCRRLASFVFLGWTVCQDEMSFQGKLLVEDGDGNRSKAPDSDEGAKRLLQGLLYWRQPVFSMTVDYKR